MFRRPGETCIRSAELLLASAMVLLPARLHWSRDSRRLLAVVSLALAGANMVAVIDMSRPGSLLGFLSRNRLLILGGLLFGVQYFLTEEEGIVRGTIAVTGGGLIALGRIARRHIRAVGQERA